MEISHHLFTSLHINSFWYLTFLSLHLINFNLKTFDKGKYPYHFSESVCLLKLIMYTVHWFDGCVVCTMYGYVPYIANACIIIYLHNDGGMIYLMEHYRHNLVQQSEMINKAKIYFEDINININTLNIHVICNVFSPKWFLNFALITRSFSYH